MGATRVLETTMRDMLGTRRGVLGMMRGVPETTRGVPGMTRGLPGTVRGILETTKILTSEKSSVVVRTLGMINQKAEGNSY